MEGGYGDFAMTVGAMAGYSGTIGMIGGGGGTAKG